ncbi:MAG: DUF5009 domain-containing protein [Bacteroidales bacterium]|nr:DUF5009 domain-containing protein [Candidatus Hennigimonas equi]
MSVQSSNRRIVSIDALRGFTMGLMILSAAIASSSGLPAWMFHCQVPPPDYVFHPEIRGITWVDLVFPFFLFSMGAAFPFAISKRLESGKSNSDILLFLLRRWVTLVLFALVIGNGGSIYGWEGSEIIKGGFSILLWFGMFLSLVRTDKKTVNLTGYALVAALMATEAFIFKVPLSLYNNDIIIMILATVAFWGGFIWLFTRNSIFLRSCIWMLAIGLKAVLSYTSWIVLPEIPEWLSWVFNWGFLQYLILIIPASFVGDILLKASRRRPVQLSNPGKEGWAAAVALTAVAVQLWGLYCRQTANDLYITLSLIVIFAVLSVKKNIRNMPVAVLGFALMVAGILFDFPDGGIAKDHCNLSYLLTTGGMACIVTYFLLYLENKEWKGGFLASSGQNPMIAYTVCWFVICPLLYGCGLLGLIDSLCVGSQFWGIVRGLIITALMYLVTALFTKMRLFWRS